MRLTLPRLVLAVVALSSAAAGCFVLSHDPALSRGGVTTTTGAELDGGTIGTTRDAGRNHVAPTAAELNELSNVGR